MAPEFLVCTMARHRTTPLLAITTRWLHHWELGHIRAWRLDRDHRFTVGSSHQCLSSHLPDALRHGYR